MEQYLVKIIEIQNDKQIKEYWMLDHFPGNPINMQTVKTVYPPITVKIQKAIKISDLDELLLNSHY